MKGLLLKDFYVVTKQLKIFLIMLIILPIFGNDATTAIAIMLGAVLPMTAIAFDEQSKWNELAVTMPYSRKELILSKYILGYFGMLGSVIIALLVQIISFFIMGKQGEISLNFLFLGVTVSLCFIAINTPIMLKFGAEKGRIFFVLIMAAIGAASALFMNSGNNPLAILEGATPLMIFGIVILANLISIEIATKIKLAHI